ncbi:MAG TPA: hypothetical protein VGW33_01605 [Terriglobia bacterium]|nr:hypothetical protein [Terriglobia bacterium]
MNIGRLTIVIAWLLATGFSTKLAAQHDMRNMAGMKMNRGPAANVRVDVQNDESAHVLTIRVGPWNLPARAGMDVPQAPDLTMTVPFDGWFVAYHPRLTDAAGNTLPGRLLHHVAVYNTARSDFLCPRRPEHIFGAGGEMGEWPVTPGVGYRIHQGDRLLISTMVHNDTAASYPAAYLEIQAEYQSANAGGGELKNVYPTWFDVKHCGPSDYDLDPGRNVTTGAFTLGYSGVLIGVGGHLHDYGQQLKLVDVTRGEPIATLDARLDPRGGILSIPIARFVDRGGFPLHKGDVVQVTATYDNPTGKRLSDAAMGIAVGYFLPSDDREMAGLRRQKSEERSHQ